jgi:RES domain-containing protein
VTAFRLASGKYAPNTSGGAAGRWNHAGTQVIYTASSLALSVLEIIASHGVLPDNYVYVRVGIPEDILISSLVEDDLPGDWCANPHSETSRTLGTNWVNSLASAVLSVPSSVIRTERNYILNPAHADFARIAFSDPVPFVFDERLRRESGQ